jgi:hypothetical protein
MAKRKPAKGRGKAESISIAKRRVQMVQLYLLGKTQGEIAVELRCERTTVYRDLEAVRDEWLKDRVANYTRYQQIELQKIDRIEHAAWIGWERSLLNSVSVKDEVLAADEDVVSVQKSERTTKGQSGDPAFLNTILKCGERRCRILGLDAPVKVAPTNPEGDESYTLMVDSLEKNAKQLTTEQLKAIAAMRGSLAPAIDVQVTK